MKSSLTSKLIEALQPLEVIRQKITSIRVKLNVCGHSRVPCVIVFVKSLTAQILMI
jgi:hypothetical protein